MRLLSLSMMQPEFIHVVATDVYFIPICVYVCLPVCVLYVCKCPQKSEEGAGNPGTEAVDDVGARNRNLDSLQDPIEN